MTALALFGAGKLPEVDGALGSGIRELRSAQWGEPEAAQRDEHEARRGPS
jgi:Sec-independent protein translocase protein TatA